MFGNLGQPVRRKLRWGILGDCVFVNLGQNGREIGIHLDNLAQNGREIGDIVMEFLDVCLEIWDCVWGKLGTVCLGNFGHGLWGIFGVHFWEIGTANLGIAVAHLGKLVTAYLGQNGKNFWDSIFGDLSI